MLGIDFKSLSFKPIYYQTIKDYLLPALVILLSPSVVMWNGSLLSVKYANNKKMFYIKFFWYFEGCSYGVFKDMVWIKIRKNWLLKNYSETVMSFIARGIYSLISLNIFQISNNLFVSS